MQNPMPIFDIWSARRAVPWALRSWMVCTITMQPIQRLAWPHLPAKYRLFYRCASLWPSLAREFLVTKRRLLGRGQIVGGGGPIEQ